MKVLVWSPHTAIWVHAFPESIVAETLVQAGYEVQFIRCDEQFKSYCIAMNSHGLDINSSEAAKKLICESCIDYSKILKTGFSQNTEYFSKYMNNDITEKVNQIMNQKKEELLSLILDGIPIFNISVYETLLLFKKNNFEFSDIEWESCKVALKNTLIAYEVGKKVLEKHKPDIVLIYNTLYSVNHIFMKLAELKNIPTYLVHAGDFISKRLSSLYIVRKYPIEFREGMKKNWIKHSTNPISKTEVDLVLENLKTLLAGKHFLSYSSVFRKEFSVREFFKIPSTTKKIILATMSSYDERFAGEVIGSVPAYSNLVFTDQIEWIESLVKFFQFKQDYFLIIRVHPREFPNKRDNVKSEHAETLKEVFNKLPANVVINWPTDEVSIYDLAKESDLVLNAWSSVGEEMSLLGVPVLLFSDTLISYPAELNYIEFTIEKYFERLERLLNSERDDQYLINSYRWYNLKLNISLFQVSNTFHHHENSVPRIIEKPNGIIAMIRKIRFIFKNGFKEYKSWVIKYRKQLNDMIYDERVNDFDIVSMLSNKKNTKMELQQENSKISIHDERIYINESIQELISILFDEKDSMEIQKPLYRYLKKFSESRI